MVEIPWFPLSLPDQLCYNTLMENVIDIKSNGSYPSDVLSNFFPHSFVVDGILCGSMEGFLQSLKFDDTVQQKKVCLLTGRDAKMAGRIRTKAWQKEQKLWWRGEAFDRVGSCDRNDGIQIWDIVRRAYQSMFDQNKTFREALIATGNAKLIHSIGRGDPTMTVLTDWEFVGHLEYFRTIATREK